MRVGRTVGGVTAVAVLTLCGASAAQAQSPGYERSSAGISELTLGSGTIIKLLLDASNLGSDELEIAEITFPAGVWFSPGRACRYAARPAAGV